MEIPTSIGRYRVLEGLGQGASGFVLKVEQEIIHRIVAMKVLFAHLLQAKPILIRRFQREARLACSLVHPNIVPIFEIGEAGGVSYYTMQYIEGIPMTKCVHNEKISLKQKMDICIELCDALGLAHRRNIIHRDLKPHNVIITKDWHPVILDFGIAKSLIEEEHMTQSGHILGSAHYMAPEQAGPGDVGTFTDVFGLGVMIYEFMAGRRPFDGANVHELIYQRIEYGRNPEANRPPSMRQIDPLIPNALDRIVFRCIEARPEQRYPSANEVLQDLQNLHSELSFSEVMKSGDHSRYRPLLPVNKKASYFWPGALALVILVAIIALGVWVSTGSGWDSNWFSWLHNFQLEGAKLMQKYWKLP